MDNNILNLGTFGDIIKKPKDQEEMSFYDILAPMRKVEPEEDMEHEAPKMDLAAIQTEVKDAKYSPFIVKSFEYMLGIKMMHWQTFGFAEHKATDELFLGMLPIIDELVETAAGKYGRPYLSDCSIPVCNYESPEQLKGFVMNMQECYSTECRSLFDPAKDPEILNILDELISLVDKTMYLLTLK